MQITGVTRYLKYDFDTTVCLSQNITESHVDEKRKLKETGDFKCKRTRGSP